MKPPTKEQVQVLMAELLALCSEEEVAVVLNKTQNTVWNWKVARRLPDAANYYCMKKMLEERQAEHHAKD